MPMDVMEFPCMKSLWTDRELNPSDGFISFKKLVKINLSINDEWTFEKWERVNNKSLENGTNSMRMGG